MTDKKEISEKTVENKIDEAVSQTGSEINTVSAAPEAKDSNGIINLSKPLKKLKSASRRSKSDPSDGMSALDRELEKQEHESKKANVLAAEDPELRGKS